MNKAQRNLASSRVARQFADEVIVLTAVKSKKDDKKVAKEGLITLAFIDGINHQPVAKISLLPSTAEGLASTLGKVLKDLRTELGSRTSKKKKKKVEIQSDYIR